jgi:hypothetical protein
MRLERASFFWLLTAGNAEFFAERTRVRLSEVEVLLYFSVVLLLQKPDLD